jgi:YidC/Oxa1 family membrane protein insertase
VEQRRFVLFVVLSVAIIIGNLSIQSLIAPKPKPGQPAQQPVADNAAKKDENEAGGKKAAEKPAEGQKPAEALAEKAAEEPEPPVQWLTAGNVSPSQSKHRLGVTFTNIGAAVVRIELASARYRDMEDRSGYLGHLAPEDVAQGGGAKVNVVVPGTPAEEAGIQVGDIITSIGEKQVADAEGLVEVLATTEPGQKVNVTISRAGAPQNLSVTLGRRPLEVVRPEIFTGKMEVPKALDVVAGNPHDPLSFLLTLAEVDGNKLPAESELGAELNGVKLRDVRWNGKQIDPDTVEFTKKLPKLGLEIVKRYKIAQVDPNNPDSPAYHLTLDVEIHNIGGQSRTVAYQLDGPTGLPIEGWWYATRISRQWSGAGIRDTALLLHDKDPTLISPMQIAGGKLDPPWRKEERDTLLVYAGVDAQYFASALLPMPQKDRPLWLAQIKPILVGHMPDDPKFRTLGNVSCRLVSVTETLKAADAEKPGGAVSHSYTIFAGPKQADLLAQYPLSGDPVNNLGELIYYGWPIWAGVARLMTHILHFFYTIVGNYGIAIVMLTVLVRACMFPISRKQALGAQKMQELKPEMDRINEKYKGKPEEKTRAMQELWRKHNYNPMSGCLLAFLQLPIFFGLWRALMINVELRGAPLFGEAIRWCSNLAAPDMLAYWRDWPFIPSFITAYRGFMSLGPWLNVLPVFTISLFILQQQMFMPPATDEQTKMQQKMMKYMLILICYAYYTVPSGLCLYIIVSSLWGIAEKKLLPKTIAKPAAAAGGPSGLARLFSSTENGSAAAKRARRRQRGR